MIPAFTRVIKWLYHKAMGDDERREVREPDIILSNVWYNLCLDTSGPWEGNCRMCLD